MSHLPFPYPYPYLSFYEQIDSQCKQAKNGIHDVVMEVKEKLPQAMLPAP